MIFVDTNYFIRFLLVDVPSQHKKAVALFESGATGEVKLFTSIIVFFEIYWVMKTSYKKSKQEIISILEDVLEMRFIEIAEAEVLQEALELFEEGNIELEDCYNISYAKSENMVEFKTFDKKLLKSL